MSAVSDCNLFFCGCCLSKDKKENLTLIKSEKINEVDFNNQTKELTFKYTGIIKCQHLFHKTCVEEKLPCYTCKSTGKIFYPQLKTLSDASCVKIRLGNMRDLIETEKNLSHQGFLKLIKTIETTQKAIFFMFFNKNKKNKDEKNLKLLQLALHSRNCFFKKETKNKEMPDEKEYKRNNFFLKRLYADEAVSYNGYRENYYHYTSILLIIHDLVVNHILGFHKRKAPFLIEHMLKIENILRETDRNNDQLILISKYVKKVLDSFKFSIIKESINKKISNPFSFEELVDFEEEAKLPSLPLNWNKLKNKELTPFTNQKTNSFKSLQKPEHPKNKNKPYDKRNSEFRGHHKEHLDISNYSIMEAFKTTGYSDNDEILDILESLKTVQNRICLDNFSKIEIESNLPFTDILTLCISELKSSLSLLEFIKKNDIYLNAKKVVIEENNVILEDYAHDLNEEFHSHKKRITKPIQWQHGDVLTIGKQKWLLTCKGIKAILKISLPKKLVKHTREKRKLGGESWGKDYSFQALWEFLIENDFTSLSKLSINQFLEKYDVYLNNKKIVTKEYFLELRNLRKAEQRLQNRSKKKYTKEMDNNFFDFDDGIRRKKPNQLFGFAQRELRSSLQQTDRTEELPSHKNKGIFCISLENAKWKNGDILQVNNKKWLLKEIEKTRGFINKEKKPEELKKLWK